MSQELAYKIIIVHLSKSRLKETSAFSALIVCITIKEPLSAYRKVRSLRCHIWDLDLLRNVKWQVLHYISIPLYFSLAERCGVVEENRPAAGSQITIGYKWSRIKARSRVLTISISLLLVQRRFRPQFVYINYTAWRSHREISWPL